MKLVPSFSIFCYETAEWRDWVMARLNQESNLMVKWRIKYRTLVVVSEDQLLHEIHHGFAMGTTLVTLFSEPNIFQRCCESLSEAGDDAQDVGLKIASVDPKFGLETTISTLQQADGLAMARWLTGKRDRENPIVYRQDSNTTFAKEGDLAMKEWLNEVGPFANTSDRELAAVYGRKARTQKKQK